MSNKSHELRLKVEMEECSKQSNSITKVMEWEKLCYNPALKAQ